MPRSDFRAKQMLAINSGKLKLHSNFWWGFWEEIAQSGKKIVQESQPRGREGARLIGQFGINLVCKITVLQFYFYVPTYYIFDHIAKSQFFS